ncbi:MAG: phosphoribosylamine--glycine ligase [Spirochaetae bacterium HGW-Spirochaetae-1]|jgi:phosphoribosylamine--glycine ligase|nr:MAG: phosphoribosylamine--glycine ligase [Spirochaetae bacterium HGW-Spirochaetae-1]
MKYLVIGSGGREHTIAWRLLKDGSANEVYVAPGNGGIDPAYRVNLGINDFEGITRFCREKGIDTVVVGPEAPLAAGIVDHLQKENIPVFGPSAEAARLEGSKLFAKMIMEKYGIPTAGHHDFTGKAELLDFIKSQEQFPVVIKLDGLAAGKGVGIPESREEALAFTNENVGDTTRVFVEDFLQGEEASVLGISDGTTVLTFVAAQDHKRIFDGDRGPNTGGMGAYAPAPVVTDERLKRIHSMVLQPTIDGMKKEGVPFKGILYAGVIIHGDDIKVLEFNVRFGDPEAQVILPLLEGKLGDFIQGSIKGTLHTKTISFKKKHAITVVMSSGGYPGDYEKGKEITGLDSLSNSITAFHAGTVEKDGKFFTNGGRVLNITALGDSLVQARDAVYNEIDRISFDDAFYRKDIAHRALK